MALGGGRVGGPHAQVNLNFARRGQDRRLHVVVARINRRDALIDVRFAHSRDAQFARHQAHSRREARQARFHLRGEHGFQFVRRAGKQNDDAAAAPRATARARCRDRFRGRPRPPAPCAWRAFTSDIVRPSWRKRASILLITAGSRASFLSEQIGHGVARAVVFGGAEASAGDHKFDALHRVVERVAQSGEIVADHGLARDFDAQAVELRGKEKGIGVDPVRGEQFRSDCDDFSFHRWVNVEAAGLRRPNRG